MKTKKMTTLHSGNSISRSLPPITYHYSLLTVLLLALCYFALSPAVQAVTPPPDGAYAGANTAEGQSALQSLTSGIHNTALGYQTLFSNTTGHDNMATGSQALYSNTTGIYNTGNGPQALYKNTTGNYNTAAGFRALYTNNTGSDNTANGYEALAFNTNSDNMAAGFKALYNNTTGFGNTANGSKALYKNSTGGENTANGEGALFSNSTADGNTADGFEALSNNTGGFNIALGYHAGLFLTTGVDNIDIGNEGVAGDSETIRIGIEGFQTATFIAGIYGENEGGMISAVYINSNGQLGTQPPVSSRRFKTEIKPMDKASEAILALQPVTFRYKKEIDPKGVPQFGLVAEEVEKVNPDLVVRDAEGKPYSVRYEAVNAMLLNEFLKEHRTVQEQGRKAEEQERTIAQLKSTVAQQQKEFQAAAAHQQEQIEALTAGLRRVSAQVEMSRPAPQTALNNQ
jgi:hypothetical protein